MKKLFNSIMATFFRKRYKRISEIKSNSLLLQEQMLTSLVDRGQRSQYGKENAFKSIKGLKDFQKTPINNYESLKKYIDKSLSGEADILWPGRTKWFAKSSGTTDRSKYIPMSDDSYHNNHHKSGWDTTTILYQEDPECEIFHRKSLIMGGSLKHWEGSDDIQVGDVSAILLSRLPRFSHPYYSPDFETALHDDWEEKLERMTKICSVEDIVMFGGVPTWTIVLFNKILQRTGAASMEEVWPNAKYYIHGGVGFDPYQKQFDQYFPSKKLDYYEVYNASEGYFAVADTNRQEGMLLLTNNDVFYEFIDMKEYGSPNANVISLKDVELDKQYALIITTSSGLWRYEIGDTIRFTSINPYRIKVMGRTKHFINVFGEEVMECNTETALAKAMDEYPAKVSNYTVGPIYMKDQEKGGHHWIIEFDEAPEHIERFATLLDVHLQAVNSDYAAKRSQNLALDCLKIDAVKKGTFHQWLKRSNKIGGQHKVPRLSNDRKIINELLEENLL